MPCDYRISGHLGSGQFGYVKRGVWRNGTQRIDVALKLLNADSSEEDKVRFLQEAAIMVQFKHPNVLFLYGVVSKTKPVGKTVKYSHFPLNSYVIVVYSAFQKLSS